MEVKTKPTMEEYQEEFERVSESKEFLRDALAAYEEICVDLKSGGVTKQQLEDSVVTFISSLRTLYLAAYLAGKYGNEISLEMSRDWATMLVAKKAD